MEHRRHALSCFDFACVGIDAAGWAMVDEDRRVTCVLDAVGKNSQPIITTAFVCSSFIQYRGVLPSDV
jgi:hypothetical protein